MTGPDSRTVTGARVEETAHSIDVSGARLHYWTAGPRTARGSR